MRPSPSSNPTGSSCQPSAVTFSNDSADCDGHLGIFHRGTQPRRVIVCSDLKFVLTHELAHTWIDANVTAEIRTEFTAWLDLESWNDPDTEWDRRGEELAAYMIQQNLMGLGGAEGSDRWQERVDAYEMLTGEASPLARKLG